MADTPSPISDWAGRLTLLGSEATYLGVVGYLIWITWDAASGVVPQVSGAVSGVAGALATGFGIGYASVLGVSAATTPRFTPPTNAGLIRKLLAWLNHVLTLNNLLGVGVFAYMVAGAALGLTFIFNESESPGIVKTIAVAFGGYVIAYIGLIYKNYR